MATSPYAIDGSLTLDKVDKAVCYWRANKHKESKSGIPDELWKNIFKLEDVGSYSDKKLRHLFDLNSAQYKKKRQELGNTATNVSTDNSNNQPAEFCEVTTQATPPVVEVPPLTMAHAAETKKTVRHLKSTNQDSRQHLDTSTIIVECIHPDGHRLKLHTTNQGLDLVIKAFYQQGVQI